MNAESWWTTDWAMQDISAAGTAFECYHPNGAKLTDDVVESCTRHGIKINAWTINDMALLEKLAT